jgi:hypothetical protein
MGSWKTVVWATGILAATGIGAGVAPRAEGQAKIAAVRQAKPAIVQVLAGTGSWIGVSVRDVVADDVSKMKLPGPEGVVVEEVTRESPAETAGLKAGDVIVEFDGDRVRSTRQFTRLVQETPSGRKVQARSPGWPTRAVDHRATAFGKGHYFDEEFPQFAKDWFVPPVSAPPAPAAPPAAPAPPVPAFRGSSTSTS